jgi:hypothetical protein
MLVQISFNKKVCYSTRQECSLIKKMSMAKSYVMDGKSQVYLNPNENAI